MLNTISNKFVLSKKYLSETKKNSTWNLISISNISFLLYFLDLGPLFRLKNRINIVSFLCLSSVYWK